MIFRWPPSGAVPLSGPSVVIAINNLATYSPFEIIKSVQLMIICHLPKQLRPGRINLTQPYRTGSYFQGTMGVHSEHGQPPHAQSGPQPDRPHRRRSLWGVVQACQTGHDLQQAPDPASRSSICKVSCVFSTPKMALAEPDVTLKVLSRGTPAR